MSSAMLPREQNLPQALQLSGSMSRSVSQPGMGASQSPSGAGQAHAPPTQSSPKAQAIPHIPQCAASPVVSTHIAEQHVPLAQPAVQSLVLSATLQYSQGTPGRTAPSA